ncbi:MAG TPA: cbb3-type cytochrome c oxidase subunit I [Gemmatimonadales bacterium]
MSGTLPDRPIAAWQVEPAPVSVTQAIDPARRFATLTFLRGALVAVAITLIAGFLAALYSIPALAPAMQSIGLDMRQLRPIHTVFATSWIFLGAAAVVYRFLEDQGGPATSGDRWRLRVQVLSWAGAGAGILGTLLLRIGSGREYVGFHPAFSLLIVVGWICYVWNVYRVIGRSFWQQPIYVMMWGVALFFFLYTFAEQHAYLLPGVFADPVHDLRVQWKATGTLVGSFNLFVYGTIIYVGGLIAGDDTYCHSKTAYALFFVGLLNSFTNFGHHTYHLPQSAWVNWIAFVVSMTEIIVLARAVHDLWCLVRANDPRPFSATRACFTAAKWWTVAILFSSVLISIPPLNAVIHGTYVVTGHAMGATIGIDTMILLGGVFWVLGEFLGRRGLPVTRTALDTRNMRRIIIGLNLGVAALVVWLHVSGLVTAIHRAALAPNESYVAPAWLGASSGIMFALTGAVVIVFFALLLARVMPRAFAARA